MTRGKTDRSSSFHKHRVSPYPSSSRPSRNTTSNVSLEANEIKEWEEVRCSVCMEHPHNAVLLMCTSNDKGCRPYMCDTSYRHSNCLDQFRKNFAESSSAISEAINQVENLAESQLLVTSSSHIDSSNVTGGPPVDTLMEENVPAADGSSCENKEVINLSCPLCRGQVKGWIVLEAARVYMNAKQRCCSQEDCPFMGTYADLRKHARLDHPLARPSAADPGRQRDWRRLEQQRDIGDVLSSIRSAMPGALFLGDTIVVDADDVSGDDVMDFPSGGNLWTVLLLIRVLRPGSPLRRSRVLPTRFRSMPRTRRRTNSVPAVPRLLWGESLEDAYGIGDSSEGGHGVDGSSTSGQWNNSSRHGTPDSTSGQWNGSRHGTPDGS